MELFEMMCLRDTCTIRRSDRMRNLSMGERYGCKMDVVKRVSSKVLRWFEHFEKMRGERLIEKGFWTKLDGIEEEVSRRVGGETKHGLFTTILNVLNYGLPKGKPHFLSQSQRFIHSGT